MKLQADIQEYKAIAAQQAELYASIKDDHQAALQARETRRELMAKKRQAAENILMSVMGMLRADLMRLGLYDLYSRMASGEYVNDSAMYLIVEQTIEHFNKQ